MAEVGEKANLVAVMPLLIPCRKTLVHVFKVYYCNTQTDCVKLSCMNMTTNRTVNVIHTLIKIGVE